MFKVKSSKKRILTAHNAKEAATLDARHQQILQDMQDKQGKLDHLIAERAQLSRDLEVWNAEIAQMQENDGLDTPPYDAAWSSNIHISQHIRAIDHEIASIRSCEDEINYFERTASILFEYYDLIESQSDIASTPRIVEPPRAPKGRKKATPVVATRSILEAFKIAEPTPDPPPQTDVPSKPVVDKSALVDDFMAATDASYVRPCATVADTGLCEECQTPLLCMQQEGIMICSKCGYQELLLVEQNRPILRTPSAKEASHFSYKRINHFRNILWSGTAGMETCATC